MLRRIPFLHLVLCVGTRKNRKSEIQFHFSVVRLGLLGVGVGPQWDVTTHTIAMNLELALVELALEVALTHHDN